MDEARSLTYSINVSANTSQADENIRNLTSSIGSLQGNGIRIDVSADTSQAESNIRNVTGSLGSLSSQAGSIGSAFRSSFLESIDSGNSFSSSLKSGVGGAFSYVIGKAGEFRDNVVQNAQSIGQGFAHPIETIKSGLGNALQSAKGRFIDMARGAEQAASTTEEIGTAAGNARRDVEDLGNAAEESGGKFEKFGGILKGAGTAIAAVSAAAAAGAVALGKEVVSAYAEYEQLVGGVDTLFGEASKDVQNYAANAFSTAGLSANQYMELATSFSSSLIKSLGGDTALAAKYADTAITDMADNANKMGTSIESIQNAYRGFSMGNFTMLDNLKLGYGGTQEEMQKLLDHAETLPEAMGKEFDISNYADIVEAIHLVQGEMGIAGATAEEAADTISGSIASTKAAFQNLIAGLGNPDADIGVLVDNVVANFGNVVKNITPVVENLAAALPTALGSMIPAIGSLLPPILSAAAGIFGEVLSSLIGLLPELIPVAVDAVLLIAQTIVDNVPLLVDAALTLVITLAESIGTLLPTLIPTVVDAIVLVVNTLVSNIPMLIDAGLQLISGLAEGLIAALPVLIEQLPTIINGIITALAEGLPMILEQGAQIIMSLVDGIITAIPLLVEQIPIIVDSIITFFTENMPMILEQGIQIIVELANGILGALPVLMEQLPTIITTIVSSISENFPLILETGVSLLLQLASGIITAIPQLVSQLPAIISAIVSGIGGLLGSIVELGGNIVKGLWEGIKAMGSWITDKVKGFFSGIVDGVKGLLGIHSPSTVFAGIGDNMALGLGEGFGKTIGGVTKDIEKSLPTEFDLPSIDVPDPDIPTDKPTANVMYRVSPVVEDVNAPAVADVTYGVNPVVGDFNPPDAEASIVYGGNQQGNQNPEAGGGGSPESAGGAPAFAPVITIHVDGNADEKAIEDMRTTLYDTVKELFAEFREEELERMALKSQYAF